MAAKLSNREIPDLFLEQQALGEYEGDRDLDQWKDQVENLQEENRAFLESHPSSLFLARAKKSQEKSKDKEKKKATFFLSVISPFVLGAAAIFFVLPLFQAPPLATQLEGIRLKGVEEPVLKVFVKRDIGPMELEQNDLIYPGDLLQLAYQARGIQYGIILSSDGNQIITTHLAQGRWSAILDQNGTINLPFSYELDNAPDYERFFLFYSQEPFLLENAMNYIKNADLPLKEEIGVVTFNLKKEN